MFSWDLLPLATEFFDRFGLSGNMTRGEISRAEENAQVAATGKPIHATELM